MVLASGDATLRLVRLQLLAAAVAALAFASPAAADSWLPHPADATWTYEWTDSVYSPTPTKEKVTVKEQKGSSFTLAWTTEEQDNPPDAVVSVGNVSFLETAGGLVNTDWQSNAPPANFPILCARAAGCGNSLASTYYNVIWGSRSPVLAGPLKAGAGWTSTGGGGNDVASSSDYVGLERVSVPAFPQPVQAAKVRSEVTQAGALGDPYGSGLRTVWWVWGVGPVKIVFEHAGGPNAPVTTSVLRSTSLVPKPPPPDADYFPLRKGLTTTYRWTNSRHMKKASVQRFTIDEVVNASARFSVKSVSGPIKVAGAYGFTSRLDGITNIWGTAQAASLAKLPPLGPRSLPAAKRRRFLTPFDLMTFGFNPLIPAYPTAGERWVARTSGRDFAVYGVTGTTTVVGVRTVKVRARTFRALQVRTILTQAGFPFGSGTRTSWFAPGKGLVKLVFRHGDGSTSTVELIR
jgi:hypothetical protein